MTEQIKTKKTSLDEIFQQYWDKQLEMSPSYATFCGVFDYNDRLEDLSVSSWKTHLNWLSHLREELLQIGRDELESEELISREILLEKIDSEHRIDQFPTHFLAINQMTGVHLSFYQIAKVHPFRNAQDLQDFNSRIKAHSQQLLQIIELLTEGIQHNWVLPVRVVDLVVSQLEALNSEEIVLERIHQFISDQNHDLVAQNSEIWSFIKDSIKDSLLTSYDQLINFLSNVYRESANQIVGLCGLPHGKELYQEYIQSHTTLPELSAEVIHNLGLQEVDRIHSEMRRIQKALNIDGDLQNLFEAFRNNTELHYQNRQEIVQHHRALLEEMNGKLSDYFEDLPQNPFEVHPLPSYQEKESPDAFYMPGNLVTGRPGVYYVNTYQPETRGRYNAEVLAYHEAVPGHHLQIAIAQELSNLPTFRKHNSVTAYVEGWALYTEKLSEEMGFYKQLESKFGRLSFELWRACRLVVDTGLHAFGWSREEAVDFMRSNTGLSHSNIDVEVDRYIVMPGQALSYKIGERFMLDLRNMVREFKGDEFSLKEFHRVILEHGAVPLPILANIIRKHYSIEENQ